MPDKQAPDYPNPFSVWEPLMEFWFNTMLAGTQHTLHLWMSPFNPPLEDEREEKGDLDIPGPLERDFEDSLHA